jgi:hypothetical protein
MHEQIRFAYAKPRSIHEFVRTVCAHTRSTRHCCSFNFVGKSWVFVRVAYPFGRKAQGFVVVSAGIGRNRVKADDFVDPRSLSTPSHPLAQQASALPASISMKLTSVWSNMPAAVQGSLSPTRGSSHARYRRSGKCRLTGRITPTMQEDRRTYTKVH